MTGITTGPVMPRTTADTTTDELPGLSGKPVCISEAESPAKRVASNSMMRAARTRNPTDMTDAKAAKEDAKVSVSQSSSRPD